jgi:hypothetical protein
MVPEWLKNSDGTVAKAVNDIAVTVLSVTKK